MPLIYSATRDRIRELNDAFRTSLDPTLGRVVMTFGVDSMPVGSVPKVVRDMVLRTVASFDAFTPENDPHGEHDFGSFEIDGETFNWKIDYYDQNMEYGSEDPADPAKTTRVLTIMLAEEY